MDGNLVLLIVKPDDFRDPTTWTVGVIDTETTVTSTVPINTGKTDNTKTNKTTVTALPYTNIHTTTSKGKTKTNVPTITTVYTEPTTNNNYGSTTLITINSNNDQTNGSSSKKRKSKPIQKLDI